VAVTAVFVVVSAYRFTLGVIERRFILGAFKHYLAPAVVDEILDDPGQLSLGGSVKDVTVLFTDIADFTKISERMTPSALTELLRSYFEVMMETLLAHRATLDKFIGDAIMVFFGCPIEQPDHAAQAVAAAREMQRASQQMNRDHRERGLPELTTRIGINSGEVVAGNMGTSSVFNYTVVGDNVNLASRLEGANKAYGTRTIASGSTVAQLEDRSDLRLLDVVRVKGKSEAVEVYEVMPQAPGETGPPESLASRRALIESYEKALASYRLGRWDEAIAGFEELAARFDDRASAKMISRCEAYRKAPPAEWDGVHVMTEK
jgi:adenylate cyclase